MDQLLPKIKKQINESLISIILSNQRVKNEMTKVKIRPVVLDDSIYYQASVQKGTQVFHQNYSATELLERIEEWLTVSFKQMELKSETITMTALVSKKGKASVKVRQEQNVRKESILNNRQKHYILQEGMKIPFMIDLGIMTKEGKIVQKRYDKFRQMNRFLEFIEDILPKLPDDRELTILDFGCGKSYLTFAMYYYLHELKSYQVRIVGLDLKKDVIAHCNQMAEKYGYKNLSFLVGDIKDYEGFNQVDMVVTLHACDTATDYALAKAVTWNAKVILSVPCCQHELNMQMSKKSVLSPMLKYGLIKERFAALATDAIRAQLLEQLGYQTQILEFIDMEHTPKNILIRAVRTNNKKKNEKELQQFCELLGIEPMLAKLLNE